MMMRPTTSPLLAMAALMVLLPSGCSTIKETATDLKKSVVTLFWGAEETLTAEELAISGMDQFENGNYHKAIEHFQRLKDIYPFSRFAILAELKLGDAHYMLEQYEDALFAYEEFEKLHPRNEAIPYDRIMVLARGSIIEVGTHDELLRRGGQYQRLHAMQFQDVADA